MMQTPESQDEAENLDSEVLGGDDSGDSLPGLNEYTDSPHMMASEDPSIGSDGVVVDDDEVIREWRDEPDVGETPRPDRPDDEGSGVRLFASETGQDNDVPSVDDLESELVAEGFDTDNPSAEEAAIHIEEAP